MNMQDVEVLAARLGDHHNLYINLQNILLWAFGQSNIRDIPASQAFDLFQPFFHKNLPFFSALQSFTVATRQSLLACGKANKGVVCVTDYPFVTYLPRLWGSGKTSYTPRSNPSFFLLGWDSGVALHNTQTAPSPPVSYVFDAHVKTAASAAPAEKEVPLVNEDGSPSGYTMLAGSGVEQLMTVGVSSCSVCLFMDTSRNHLLFTHLDASSASPFSVLKEIAGWTEPLTSMAVSMVHDFEEIQRILSFAAELGVKQIEIIDRGALADYAPNAHLYAGLSLCGNTPHMFISFGSAAQLVTMAYSQTAHIKKNMQPDVFFNILARSLGYPVDTQRLYEAVCAAFPDKSAVKAFPASGTPKALMDFLCENRSLLDTDPLFVQSLSPFFRSYYTPALCAGMPVL